MSAMAVDVLDRLPVDGGLCLGQPTDHGLRTPGHLAVEPHPVDELDDLGVAADGGSAFGVGRLVLVGVVGVVVAVAVVGVVVFVSHNDVDAGRREPVARRRRDVEFDIEGVLDG
jgi:hypothetical protein